MLVELRLRAGREYRSVLFLGPILDDFHYRLRSRGYAFTTRRLYLFAIRHIVRHLEEHHRCELGKLRAKG